MNPRSGRVVPALLRVGGTTGIFGLAFVAFLLVPDHLLYNEVVASVIVAGTIVAVSAFVRVTTLEPDSDRSEPGRLERGRADTGQRESEPGGATSAD